MKDNIKDNNVKDINIKENNIKENNIKDNMNINMIKSNSNNKVHFEYNIMDE